MGIIHTLFVKSCLFLEKNSLIGIEEFLCLLMVVSRYLIGLELGIVIQVETPERQNSARNHVKNENQTSKGRKT